MWERCLGLHGFLSAFKWFPIWLLCKSKSVTLEYKLFCGFKLLEPVSGQHKNYLQMVSFSHSHYTAIIIHFRMISYNRKVVYWQSIFICYLHLLPVFFVKSVIVLWFKRSIYIQLWALVATKPCVEALWRLTTSLNIAPNTKAYIVFQGMISDHRNLERCAGLLLTLKDEPLEPPQRAGFYLNIRDGRQWLLNMPLSAVVVIVI